METEEEFEKIQHPVMIFLKKKTLSEVRSEENFLNLINAKISEVFL